MTERRSNAPGYQPRQTVYVKRTDSIDGVLRVVSNTNPTPQNIEPTPTQETKLENPKLNFSPDELLKEQPAQYLEFKPTKTKPKKHKPIRRPRKHHVALFMVIAGFIVFGTIATNLLIRRHKTSVLSASIALEEQKENHAPLEELPATPQEISVYNVAPAFPRVLRIQQLGIETRVYRTGIKPNGMLNAVRNIYDSGWFEESGKPGDAEPILIAAHVHGPTKPGIFYNLNKLTIGSELELERGDGRVFRYKVVRTKEFNDDKFDLKLALTNLDQGKAGLNLMTYPGVGDNGGYPKNSFLVFAESVY